MPTAGRFARPEASDRVPARLGQCSSGILRTVMRAQNPASTQTASWNEFEWPAVVGVEVKDGFISSVKRKGVT